MWDSGAWVESLGISPHLTPHAQADALGRQGDPQAWAERGGDTCPFPVWGCQGAVILVQPWGGSQCWLSLKFKQQDTSFTRVFVVQNMLF